MIFFRISRQILENSDVCRFFNQICENKSEIYRKFWILWKLFTIIQNYSLVSLMMNPRPVVRNRIEFIRPSLDSIRRPLLLISEWNERRLAASRLGSCFVIFMFGEIVFVSLLIFYRRFILIQILECIRQSCRDISSQIRRSGVIIGNSKS